MADRPNLPAAGQMPTIPLLVAIGLALASPAAAQIVSTGQPATDILLSQALSEHRIFLTCSVLEPQIHQQIVQNWQRDVDGAAAALQAANVPPEVIAAFTKAAAPDALMPSPDTPFEDVRQLCDSQPDWATRYTQMNFTLLEFNLLQALP